MDAADTGQAHQRSVKGRMMGAIAANASAMTQICIRFPAQIGASVKHIFTCEAAGLSFKAHDHLPWHASSCESLNKL